MSCTAKQAPTPISNQPTIIIEPVPHIVKQTSPPFTKKEKNTLRSAKKELSKAKQLIDNTNKVKGKSKKKEDEYNPSGSLP